MKKVTSKKIVTKPIIIWFTGLSGSGKTTLSTLIFKEIKKNYPKTVFIDGDIFREGLSSDLGFSAKDRNENIRRARHVSKMFYDEGFNVVASFISPFQKARAEVRRTFPGRFIEVYCKRSLKECENLDVKGLYKSARSKQIKNFTGISSEYEAPKKPEVFLDISKNSIKTSIDLIVSFIVTKYNLKISR